MRRAAWIVLLFLPGALSAARPPLRSSRLHRAVEAVQPAVVKIFGVKGFRGVYGYRTGLIVDKSGLVLTRNSVTLEEAPQIRCQLHDGRRLPARIVREDRRTKMVILKLLGDSGATYPVAPLGDSETVRPGRFILLIGNAYKVALGKERCAVNVGVVSAVTPIAMRSGLARGAFDYPDKVILHDAMNNPGVFGGPLADLAGEVIGISGTLVESRDTNAQVHYAIPINDLKPFIDDTVRRPDAPRLFLREGADAERERDRAPGYLGAHVLKGGINRPTPAYVDRVDRGSPAAKAGLRPDDLVLRIDRMRVKSWRSFVRMMSRYHAGDEVRLTVKRGEEIKVLAIKLDTRPNR